MSALVDTIVPAAYQRLYVPRSFEDVVLVEQSLDNWGLTLVPTHLTDQSNTPSFEVQNPKVCNARKVLAICARKVQAEHSAETLQTCASADGAMCRRGHSFFEVWAESARYDVVRLYTNKELVFSCPYK